jgi:hypothetical protein
MKILFDQGTPVPLRRQLPEHDVATAFEQGWSALSGITKGDILLFLLSWPMRCCRLVEAKTQYRALDVQRGWNFSH